MSGKLIVLEGSDGSGKETQARLLTAELQEHGVSARMVTFPNYAGEASAPVRMYLAGRFGTHPSDVNAYVASTFYAVDRFASYREDWGAFYEAGGTIVADRYVTSNMVHQMTKLEDEAECEAFLAWLDDLEYTKFGLPRPDAVCLLDLPIEMTEALIVAREGQDGGDIHERDKDYLRRCQAAYARLEMRYGWHRVQCARNGKLRGKEDIHTEICRIWADIGPKE